MAISSRQAGLGVAVAVEQEDRARVPVDLPLYLVGGAWLLGLGLMFWAAVSPAPDSWFYVALGAFIGCSLAWTAVQLSSGRRVWWLIVLIVGLLLLVFGVSTLICDVWSLPWPWSPHQHPTSQWTTCAYACGYLGASYLVELLRDQVDRELATGAGQPPAAALGGGRAFRRRGGADSRHRDSVPTRRGQRDRCDAYAGRVRPGAAAHRSRSCFRVGPRRRALPVGG